MRKLFFLLSIVFLAHGVCWASNSISVSAPVKVASIKVEERMEKMSLKAKLAKKLSERLQKKLRPKHGSAFLMLCIAILMVALTLANIILLINLLQGNPVSLWLFAITVGLLLGLVIML